MRPVSLDTRCKDQTPNAEPRSATARTSDRTPRIRREKEPDAVDPLQELECDIDVGSFCKI